MQSTLNPNNQGNLILDLTFKFSLEIIEFIEHLEKINRQVLAIQLLKSGTSIGANVKEAQSAESLRDFLHKLKIAQKEVEETEYWLLLCLHSRKLPSPTIELDTLLSIRKVVGKIISRCKEKLKKEVLKTKTPAT